MVIFIIRNIFSIITAEAIIKQKEIKNAVFAVFIINNNNYYKKIMKNLSVNSKVIIKPLFYYSLNIKKYFFLKKVIDLKTEEIKKVFYETNCTEVFLSCLNDPIERHISYVANELKIKVNLYEEGLNMYFNDLGYLSTKNLLRKLLQKFFTFFHEEKYHFYSVNKKYIDIFNVYCILPKAYQFKNYQKLSKINLTFEIKNNRKIIENLLVTRPLSEDKLLDEKREIEIILNYLNKNNIKEITLKPHPRENEEKIKKIIEQAKLRQINIEIFKDEIPLEKIIEDYDIKKMIGYETGSLVYLSELYDIKCDCLLKTVVKETNLSYFKNYYNFYSKNFKKINYV